MSYKWRYDQLKTDLIAATYQIGFVFQLWCCSLFCIYFLAFRKPATHVILRSRQPFDTLLDQTSFPKVFPLQNKHLTEIRRCPRTTVVRPFLRNISRSKIGYRVVNEPSTTKPPKRRYNHTCPQTTSVPLCKLPFFLETVWPLHTFIRGARSNCSFSYLHSSEHCTKTHMPEYKFVYQYDFLVEPRLK